jgi:hypothetical protein
MNVPIKTITHPNPISNDTCVGLMDFTSSLIIGMIAANKIPKKPTPIKLHIIELLEVAGDVVIVLKKYY